jgi:hypothetical protein
MTAYEVTQDLLAATQSSPAAGTAITARSRRKPGRLRAALTAGMAAGALILAVPAASAVRVAEAPSHGAVAETASRPLESTLPSTITLTTRRTGSVIL